MNKYNACPVSFDDYQRPETPYSYRSPIGKILSIGATAFTLMSAYDLANIHEDASSLDKKVDDIVQCENRIDDNIRYIQKLMTVFVISNNDVNRQHLLDQLMSFRSLVQSWDGFGAIPTSAKCTAAAIRVINGLSDQAIEEIEDIYPNTNGSVSFKWGNGLGERISLSVGVSSFSYYCQKKGVGVELFDDVQITNESIAALNADVLSIVIENV